jgi:hypothetical protein
MTIDLNHGSGFVPGRARPETATLGLRIGAMIDNALRRARLGEPPRRYLGASIIGHSCSRFIALAYRGVPTLAPPDRGLRIFATGHTLEALLADWLRRAGFDLRTVDPATDEQFAFHDGALAGHADGVIVSGPDLGGHLSYPALWEAKGLNDKSWNNFAKRGLQAALPTYYGQALALMHYLGLKCCLFTALNKNTSELYCEPVTYDLIAARQLIERAAEIIVGSLPALPDAPLGICNNCPYTALCWGASP